MGKGFWPQKFTAERVGLQVYRLGVGANMAFTRDALQAIGGFDVRLGPGRPTRGADDLDAFLRVLASGGSAVYQPDAVVRHVHRRDLRGLVHQYRDNGAGYAALLRKHELLGGPLGDAATRERRRWRRQRHVRGVLSAVARRNLRQLIELVPEIVGSRRGAGAFDEEALQLARGVHGR
jgi:GT2 family glycosyltransferase